MKIKSLYAKCKLENKLYKVEINYKDDGRFILRPAGWLIKNTPVQYITQSAQQVKDNFRLFPVVGV